MQAGPKASALRTPSHFAAGWGAFHRRSPTGVGDYQAPREYSFSVGVRF